MRLLVPLIAAYFLLVVPTAYTSCEYVAGVDSTHCKDSFFQFYSWMVSHFVGGFWWLWFLPALFALACLNYPFQAWYSFRYWENLKGIELHHDRLYLPILFAQAVGAIVGLHFGLKVSMWYGFFVVLPYLSNIALLYGVHVLREAKRIELMLWVAQVVPSLVLTVIHSSQLRDEYVDRIIGAVCFFNFFYMQGFVDQVLDAEYLQFIKSTAHKKLRPLGLFLLMVLLAVTSPGSEFNVGYLWTFPLYRTWPETMVFVAGSWLWLSIFVWWGQTFFDFVQDSKFLYTHLTASSIIVYVAHWFFINVLVVSFTKPFELGVAGTITVLLVGSVLLSWALYALACHVPFLGLVFGLQPPKPKTEAKALSLYGLY